MNFKKYFSTIDTHVAGEAFRIVTNSSMKFAASTIKEAAEVVKKEFTVEKNLLLNEPRGHRGMHGCLVLPTNEADIRLLSFHHEADADFKYESLLSTITALLETGTIHRKEDDVYTIETSEGIYTVKTTMENNEVTNVSLESQGCLVIEKTEDYVVSQVDQSRDYLIYSLPISIPTLALEHLAAVQQWGAEQVQALMEKGGGYSGVILMEQRGDGQVCSVTFEKDGYILRTPGIDSSFALLTAMENEKALKNTSIFGSQLTVKLVQENEGKKKFSVDTEAFVTGAHDFILDEEDPLKEGFLLA